jgi:hypothetical protein
MRDDIITALTRLEVLSTINQKAEDAQCDHEARLRALEAFKWKLAGACLALGAALGERWCPTGRVYFASRGSAVQVPLAPPGRTSAAKGCSAGTGLKHGFVISSTAS